MPGVVFQVRERSKGNVGTSMMLWATAMAVVLFLFEAQLANRGDTAWAGILATALFGFYLGWRRRAAAVFIAPIISWLFAAMIHEGFFKGLFWGLFLITIGWLVIGFVEFAWLGAVTFLVRSFRGPGAGGEPKVIIFGPDANN
jgi:hypothetical protein